MYMFDSTNNKFLHFNLVLLYLTSTLTTHSSIILDYCNSVSIDRRLQRCHPYPHAAITSIVYILYLMEILEK